MPRLSRLLLVLPLIWLAACRPLALPWAATATPTPFVQCTPPPCQAGETYACPSGDCPGGCGTVCATVPAPVGVTPEPSLTAAETPMPMCTPPACWSDEAYFCAGNCPNGCGTTCATRTPDPAGGPPPTFPAPGAICTLPALSGDTPAVAACVNTAAAPAGATFAVLVQANGISAPIFSLQGRDAGDGFGYLSFQATAENRVRALSANSQVVRVAGIQASGDQLYLTLDALAPGAIVFDVYAGSATGPFIAGEPLTLTVTAP
ncbi:MAG: hypothetical protein JNK29_14730 [Anaerolineales bacterium]|nr:hypothetical protein [Anaerolineales bacterium]